MSEWQRLCVVQTAGQITGLLSANWTCTFSLHGDPKARKCQRDWMSPSWKKTARDKPSPMISALCSRLDAMELCSDEPEENWTVFRDTIHSSATDSLGPVSRKHQDWFNENDEEIQGLLEEKHQKHKVYLSDTSTVSNKAAYSNICKTAQITVL